MRNWFRVGASCGCVVLVAFVFSACESGCDQEVIDRARKVLQANQSCESDEDCVTVSDFCEELPGGFCGQLVMSREGSESAEWKILERELDDCAPDSCTVCLAARVPTCTNGSCGGP